MKRFSNKLFLYVSLIFLLLTGLAVPALYVGPDIWIVPSAVALGYPFLLFFNVALFLLMAFYRKKWFFIPIVAVLISYPALDNSFAFKIPAKTAEKELKIMSYNVRLFNLYDWIEDINVGNEILGLIKREQPDVLCLQEFYSNAKQRNYIRQIMETGGYEQYYCPGYNDGKHYGSVIFSRYPIVNFGKFNAQQSKNTFVFADIQAHGKTLRIYSLHLASLYLSREDYKFIDKPAENEQEKPLQAVTGILSKLRYAYERRLSESKAIHRHAQSAQLPVVLCGDFNDVPVSRSYQFFANHYKDAFKEAGMGLGNTYIRRWVRFRIDYIFVSPEFEVLEFNVLRETYSDHYPVQVILGL